MSADMTALFFVGRTRTADEAHLGHFDGLGVV
jgi:hypothetical protein